MLSGKSGQTTLAKATLLCSDTESHTRNKTESTKTVQSVLSPGRPNHNYAKTKQTKKSHTDKRTVHVKFPKPQQPSGCEDLEIEV
jgi:hypothetical protein